MFVRRVFLNKQFKSYVCPSTALECDKFSRRNFSKKSKQSIERTEENNESSSAIKPKIEKVVNTSDSRSEKRQGVSKIKFDPFEKVASSLAENVAEQLGGDKKKVKHELLNYLKSFKVAEDRFKKSEDEFNFGFFKPTYREAKNEKLEIFKPDIMAGTEKQVKLKIWNELEAEELAFVSKSSPTNYFEELINWTNEGKLWHFPIDNDQGMEEEAKISFSEHIFLEKHLKPWCPQRGPLRKFMELVLIGLSKNPYFTVEEKKAHIEWFKNYFEDKKKLLQSLGAMGPPKEIESSKQEGNL